MHHYNYHPVTLRYLGASETDPDPLEEDSWLLPAHATFVPPPVLEVGQSAVFNLAEQTWSLVVMEAPEPDQVPTPPTFAHQQGMLIKAIDDEVDAIIFAAIGNRAQEYLVAEQEARAFVDDGYPSESVPPSVEDRMLAVGLTAQESADEILAQADAWRTALAAMRRQRLIHKANASTAADVDDLAIVRSAWVGFVQVMAEQLGLTW